MSHYPFRDLAVGMRQRVFTLKASNSLRQIMSDILWIGRFSNSAASREVSHGIGSNRFSIAKPSVLKLRNKYLGKRYERSNHHQGPNKLRSNS